MYGLFGKFGSKEFAQKKGDVIYCEATHTYIMLCRGCKGSNPCNTNVAGGTRAVSYTHLTLPTSSTV